MPATESGKGNRDSEIPVPFLISSSNDSSGMAVLPFGYSEEFRYLVPLLLLGTKVTDLVKQHSNGANV